MSTIIVTFDPPTPADSPSAFNTKAFATLGDLNTWSTQANIVAGEVNTNASTASTAATTATTQAGTASTAATTATTQAGAASTSASAAAISESNAAASAIAAAAATSSKYDKTGGAISGNVSVAGDLSVSGSGGIINTYTSAAYSFGPSSTEQIYRSGNTLRFYVNGADVATLDASGTLLVGTSSAVANEKFNATGSVANNIVRVINTNAAPYGILLSYSQNITGTGNEFIDFRTNSSTQVFKVMANGDVANTNNSYGAISDIKLKQDITDATPKLAKLLKVRIVNYKFKSDPNGIKQIGVIAQELEEISPGLIEETPDYEEVTLTREVEKTVPVTIKKEVTTERVQLDVIDGVAVQNVIRETAVIDEPVVDEYPVFDGDGNPVMEVVTPATEAEIDDKGNEVKAALPAVLRQKIHTVPRMETVVDKEEYTERRLTGTTTKSVKYSIFVPMLIKAMQEQQEQIEALKAKVGA